MGITGVCLGAIVFLVAMSLGVIWRKPSKRFPDPPPGYYDWLKKTEHPIDYVRKLKETAKGE